MGLFASTPFIGTAGKNFSHILKIFRLPFCRIVNQVVAQAGKHCSNSLQPMF